GFIPMAQSTPVQVDSLESDMPAIQAGLKPGDKILSIDGHALHYVPALLAYLQDRGGKPATLLIQRDGKTFPVQLTPKMADMGDGTKDYRLGFNALLPPIKVDRLPFD